MSDGEVIAFHVPGRPVPKQSFGIDGRSGRLRGYRSDRVSAWQSLVAGMARQAMAGRGPLRGPLAVWLDFSLPDRRRLDLDNLSKGSLDALNGICWEDDRQIVELHLSKRVGEAPGLVVRIQQVGMAEG